MNRHDPSHRQPTAASPTAAPRAVAVVGLAGALAAGLLGLAAARDRLRGDAWPLPHAVHPAAADTDVAGRAADDSGPGAPGVQASRAAVDAPAAPDAPDAPAAQTAFGMALPKESIRYLGIDRAGSVWFRFAPARDGDPAVAVLDAAGRRTDHADLRAAVEARYADLRAGPSLADFWAVDPAGRVWVGPASFDGRAWTEAVPGGGGPGEDMTFDARVVVDTAGTAWVPYRIEGECAAASACQQYGLMGFTAEGAAGAGVAVDAPPEMAAHALDVVQLAPGIADAVGAPRAMYRLPGPVPVYHDAAAGPGEVATGFATAFAAAPRGLPEFYLSVERVPAGGVSVEHGVVAARWDGGRWVRTDLTGSPLFEDDRGRVAVVVAAAYGPAGELWLAASNGNMALRTGAAWLHFNARNSPLGAPIRDIAVGADRRLWVGTVDGTRTYLDGVWSSSGDVAFPRLFAPSVLKNAGVR